VLADHTRYRVAGLGDALIGNGAAIFGMGDVRGYDPALDTDYEAFATAAFASPGAGSLGDKIVLPASSPSDTAARALDLLDVKYIFAACSIRLPAQRYPLAFRGDGCVYRNNGVLPRAFLVHQAQFADVDTATTLLLQGALQPTHTVILAPGSHIPALEGSSNAAPDLVTLIRDDPEAVDLTVASHGDGILVLGDAYAPGWRAKVDGRSVPVLRADAVLRAVVVGSGVHHISFSYQPESYAVGKALSLLALCLLAGITALAVRRALQNAQV
jgi:hypothetical protein